ncbi:MAG: hypothetical protein O7D29_06150 [Gemmatimonadetes bacterium]|nr:hypothetical protein [Gemmatimonadota bacterium]
MPMRAVIEIIIVLGIACMGYAGFSAWVRHRPQQLRGEVSREDFAELLESVEGLREQVELMREEHSELFERVEFTERLLSKGGPSSLR